MKEAHFKIKVNQSTLSKDKETFLISGSKVILFHNLKYKNLKRSKESKAHHQPNDNWIMRLNAKQSISVNNYQEKGMKTWFYRIRSIIILINKNPI